MFSEKRSGLDGGGRAGRVHAIRTGRRHVIVTKLDRLARSTADLYRIVTEFADKGVGFKVLDDAAVDTTTRTGKLVMGILALIAEFETEIRKERQMEGIARAKAEGRMGGRPKLVTEDMRDIYGSCGKTVPASERSLLRLGFQRQRCRRFLA